jgi:EAL domain-containing protein (putative c-di-GMP-specific phosphodiesterase class I)
MLHQNQEIVTLSHAIVNRLKVGIEVFVNASAKCTNSKQFSDLLFLGFKTTRRSPNERPSKVALEITESVKVQFQN